MANSTRLLRIDVTADVVCPWSLIGTRRLERALSQSRGVTFDVVYHPFLVEAELPRESAAGDGCRASRYGNPEPLLRRLEGVAREDGVDLDLSRVHHNRSSVGAHTLLRHARARGSQRALARALFGAHFLEGRDVSSEQLLELLGRSHGFDAGEASALVRDAEQAELTRAEARAALDQGVVIAPHVVVDQRLSIAGAQPVEVFRRALERALASP